MIDIFVICTTLNVIRAIKPVIELRRDHTHIMAVVAPSGLFGILFTRMVLLHVLFILFSNLLSERLEREQLIVQVARLGLPQEVLGSRSGVSPVAIEWI